MAALRRLFFFAVVRQIILEIIYYHFLGIIVLL